MTDKCIHAEKENGKDFFAPEYDGFIEAVQAGTLEKIEEYGGRYDRVVRLKSQDGKIYRTERFPAASMDFVSHVYLEETAVNGMSMSIVYAGSSEVFVTIDGKEHKVDSFYGEPVDDSDETFERWIRMNVHFWMGRAGLDDDAPEGEYWSSICPFQIEYH